MSIYYAIKENYRGKGYGKRLISEVNKWLIENKNVDLIIIARGGGSLEDLWPFNEEITANAIYESELPIISAVGHEKDFKIADFAVEKFTAF